MTFIYFIVWLICGTPHITFYDWNNWAITLVICIGLDVLGILKHE